MMRIPSYDDLTPSIPDIRPRETLAQVHRFLPRPAAAGGAAPAAPAGLAAPQLFACLRAARARDTMRAIARDFSPRLERHGADSIVLDVAGLGRLLGDAAAIGAELDRAAAAREVTMHIAVAPSLAAARLLAIAYAGLTVRAGDVAAAVAPLPLDTLRILTTEDGADDPRAAARVTLAATASRLETFRRWGLTTLGDIAALPSAELSGRMGQGGLALQQLARGIDRQPLVPDPGVPRFVQAMDLEWPIDALEPLSFVLARLLEPLSSAMARADRAAAALRLDLRLVDRTTHARVLPLPAAIRDPKVLRTLLLLDLESHPPAAGIDRVTIELDPAPARIVQYSLLERAMPSPETLATLTARLGALVGDGRIGSPVLLDSWRPDAFAMRRFDPASEPSRSTDALDMTARQAAAPPAGAAATSDRVMLRRFRPPIAVRVSVSRGRPVHLAIDRRGMPGGPIEQASGPWRTSGAWWDPEAAAWDRDEWDAALGDGSICRLFHDRVADRWFIDGIVD
jgi:protein ImuB